LPLKDIRTEKHVIWGEEKDEPIKIQFGITKNQRINYSDTGLNGHWQRIAPQHHIP
jgi:hypothetical protein